MYFFNITYFPAKIKRYRWQEKRNEKKKKKLWNTQHLSCHIFLALKSVHGTLIIETLSSSFISTLSRLAKAQADAEGNTIRCNGNDSDIPATLFLVVFLPSIVWQFLFASFFKQHSFNQKIYKERVIQAFLYQLANRAPKTVPAICPPYLETMMRKKTFILDTNVILHDSSCIYHFEEHDIVIPITVLEELDQFKKGNQIINYHAREFTRALDSLSGKKLFNGGVSIGPDKGRISVKLELPLHEKLRDHFPATAKPDHQILNIACYLAEENKDQQVTLVTKDVNLRMKAKAIGLDADDYTTDHVSDLADLYTGCRYEEGISTDFLESFFSNTEGSALPGTENFNKMPVANEYLILRNGKKSALAHFDAKSNALRHVNRLTVYGITPRNAEQTFAVHALMNHEVPLVTVTGKAGTGKTLLALASSLEQRSHFRQILLARPIIPLSNKDIGYLPGDVQSKIKPYMQPLYDNLSVIRSQFSESSEMNKRLNRLMEEEKLIIEPLAYIRGRSLVKLFMIIDEAQNLTPHEVKTIITRAGEGTRIIFTGDVHQIDHPYLDRQSNGLSHLIEKLHGHHLYAHINLEKGERSQLAELASTML